MRSFHFLHASIKIKRSYFKNAEMFLRQISGIDPDFIRINEASKEAIRYLLSSNPTYSKKTFQDNSLESKLITALIPLKSVLMAYKTMNLETIEKYLLNPDHNEHIPNFILTLKEQEKKETKLSDKWKLIFILYLLSGHKKFFLETFFMAENHPLDETELNITFTFINWIKYLFAVDENYTHSISEISFQSHLLKNSIYKLEEKTDLSEVVYTNINTFFEASMELINWLVLDKKKRKGVPLKDTLLNFITITGNEEISTNQIKMNIASLADFLDTYLEKNMSVDQIQTGITNPNKTSDFYDQYYKNPNERKEALRAAEDLFNRLKIAESNMFHALYPYNNESILAKKIKKYLVLYILSVNASLEKLTSHKFISSIFDFLAMMEPMLYNHLQSLLEEEVTERSLCYCLDDEEMLDHLFNKIGLYYSQKKLYEKEKKYSLKTCSLTIFLRDLLAYEDKFLGPSTNL
jgi:hypothetical protein